MLFCSIPIQSRKLFILIFFTIIKSVSAQSDIPVGGWRIHISYNTINSIAVSNTHVYGATDSGIMVLDRAENSISSFSKINGLSGSVISYINYNATTQQLVVAYADGNMDIIRGNEITSFSRLKDVPIVGTKRINHIAFNQNLAYLSTDFGVVVFNLSLREIKETWRDLGESGKTIRIHQSTFLGDSIFLATESGVLAGNLNDNLLDFNQWNRYNQNELNTSVHGVATFTNAIYAAVSSDGVYRNENGTWIKESFLQDVSFQSLTASSNHLIITGGDQVWKLSSTNELTQLTSNLLTSPRFTQEDENGTIWIGDTKKGLLSEVNGDFNNYLPNGPSIAQASRLKYHDQKLHALKGGYSNSNLPLGNTGEINIFSAGQWSSSTAPVMDVTDIAFSNETIFISSFGYGVQAGNITNPDIIYNDGNSTLINLNPGSNAVNIPSIENSPQGLWVANYDATTSLHLFSQNTWEAFTFPFAISRFPIELSVDFYGSVWAILNPAQGGGLLVFNKERNQSTILTDEAGSGGLPDRRVTCIANDRDGFVWVGMERGVAYFFNPPAVFGTSVNAARPIFENRFLLSDEKITAIAVDGGNRKWIGTERGVWLFNPTGEELVYNFTEENSPLLSNVIRAIEIDSKTGEVFFATDKGICSFRSDATESKFLYQAVKIFPNPVTANFNGTIGISGLATDAVVKITDVSGKLIWETRANGGTATWNVRDYNGRRASTGMYLIFSATQDGSENFVGKIAVID